jgi:putative endonuclease
MQREISPTVYMLASRHNGTLYTGVTSNLIKRLYEHRNGLIEGFTNEYGVKRLVWFEQHDGMDSAILREKRIKKWNRQWKIEMIEANNPDWDDLALGFGFEPLPSLRSD